MKAVKGYFQVSIVCLVLFNISVPLQAKEFIPRELIPSEGDLLYYKLGGGRGHQLPPVEDTTRIPIDLKGVGGLGYSCGVFNPAASITNSFKNIKSSLENLDDKIIQSATGAIINMPFYVASRANPTLAQNIRNHLIGFKEDFTFSFKSCEQMESDALNSNPVYDDIVKVSLGTRWKQEIGIARRNENLDDDINVAKERIIKDQGRSGLPWIGGQLAGGSPLKGQNPIFAIKDTAKAGYNVMFNRDMQDDSPPSKSNNHYLASLWPTPDAAARWIVNVVGDIKISSCSDDDCKKGSEPGKGLILFAEELTQAAYETLMELVNSVDPVNKDILDTLSMPGLAITPDVITAIRNQEPVNRVIWVNNLSAGIAARHIIDYAMMGQRLLRVGRQIPEVINNPAIYTFIEQAIKTFDEEINLIVQEQERRKSLVASTIEGLLEFDDAVRKQAMLQDKHDDDQQPVLRDGALFKQLDD